jgi:DNA-directed RNA polymerase specialized sigma24 family protein
MITQSDLKNLIHLRSELEHIEKRIRKHKPAEIVIDSVQGSSPSFPFVSHTIKIEGLEHKKDKLSWYYEGLQRYKAKLEKEVKRIENEIEKIPYSEVRQIIRLHHIEGLSYVQVKNIMGYNTPETPRIKLFRYLSGESINEDDFKR